jgi:hypothetical protein
MMTEYLDPETNASRTDAQHLDFLALWGRMPWLPAPEKPIGKGARIPTYNLVERGVRKDKRAYIVSDLTRGRPNQNGGAPYKLLRLDVGVQVADWTVVARLGMLRAPESTNQYVRMRCKCGWEAVSTEMAGRKRGFCTSPYHRAGNGSLQAQAKV